MTTTNLSQNQTARDTSGARVAAGDIEALRAQFEKSFGSAGFDLSRCTICPTEYACGYTNDVWLGYQAGHAAGVAAERDAFRADAERLDWIIEHRAYVVSDPDCCDGYWLNYARPDGTTWTQATEHETPRAAIDAAKGESNAA